MRLLSRDEIAAGIRNALERGNSLDSAIQSFINAGYNPNEVEEAAKLFHMGGVSIISNSNPGIQPHPSPLDSTIPINQSSNVNIQSQVPISGATLSTSYPVTGYKRKSHTFMIIFLVIILLLILSGIISAVIFKDEIAEFFSTLLS